MSKEPPIRPQLESYLAHKFRDRPTTRADLIFGIPLCLAIGTGSLFKLHHDLKVGETSFSRDMTARWSEDPGWFILFMGFGILLTLLMFLAPWAFVKNYRRQRHHQDRSDRSARNDS